MCQRTVLDVTTTVMAALQHLCLILTGGAHLLLVLFLSFLPGDTLQGQHYSSYEIRAPKFVLCGYVCTLYLRFRSQ